MSALQANIQVGDQVHVGAGIHVGPVSVFPVWTATRSAAEYSTLALTGLEVKELDPARVDTLSVINRTGVDILIPEGTIIYGGLQTRVLACDSFLGAGRSDLLEVRCVEQGRWGNKVDTAFAGRAPITVMGALRGIGGSRAGRRQRADQGDVWRRVNYYEKSYGSRRSSSLESIINFKMQDMMFESESITTKVAENTTKASTIKSELTERVGNALPGQNGVIIGLSGHPVLFETFNSEQAFREQLQLILDAIAIDAPMASGMRTSAARAIKFAQTALAETLVPSQLQPNLLRASTELLDIRSLVGPAGDVLHTVAVSARHNLVTAA